MSAPRKIDYYFSVTSPWAYLGAPRLAAMVERHALRVEARPIGLIVENGGVSIRSRPAARRAYQEVELARWSRQLVMPLNVRPRHRPTDGAPGGRLVTAAILAGHDGARLAFALQRAIWAEERDIADPAVRGAIADENGMPGVDLVAAENTPEVAALWDANTEHAREAGVFGVPSYVFEGELFWGQDRLDSLERRIAGGRG